jgi:hypothetical protein
MDARERDEPLLAALALGTCQPHGGVGCKSRPHIVSDGCLVGMHRIGPSATDDAKVCQCGYGLLGLINLENDRPQGSGTTDPMAG